MSAADGLNPADSLGWPLATMSPVAATASYSAGAGAMVATLATAQASTTVTTLGTLVTAAGASPAGVNGMILCDWQGDLIAATGSMTTALSSTGYAEGTLVSERTVKIVQGQAYFLALLANFGTEPGIAGAPGLVLPASGVDLVGAAVQGDQGGLVGLAPLGPQEHLPQQGGLGDSPLGRGRLLPPGGRRLAGPGVDGLMLGALGPGLEQAFHLRQARDLLPATDLDEELVPDSPEVALDFPLPSGFPGREWMSFMPGTAQPRSSHASTKALPLPG